MGSSIAPDPFLRHTGTAYSTGMYRMLACDIDHTLLPLGGEISESDMDTLKELHASGVTVVLATGRATFSTRRILTRIFPEEHPDYLICYNGAQVLDLNANTELLRTNIPAETVAELSRWCRSSGAWLQGYEDAGVLVEQDTPYVRNYAESSGMNYTVVPDLAAHVKRIGGTPKLVCHDEKSRLPGHDRELRELAQGRWTVVTSMPIFLEILPPETNKGTALEALAAHLGYSMDQVVAVGDNLNDIEMIQRAGVGVAVANAVPELKAVADWVSTREVTQSAVSEVARRYFASRITSGRYSK